MSQFKPYTYIQCPCSDASNLSRPSDASSFAAVGAAARPGGGASAAGRSDGAEDEDEEDDDRTFDPRAPRSDYSLYPLEYLLYCEDCHQIRCPRCVSEEIVTYYCPNCLFEVPTSNLKSEGNRCTRSCFQCPICIGPLAVTNIESAPDPSLLTADNVTAASGPYVLTCSYCSWSSTEIGIKFEKPNGIYSQLAKVRNGGERRLTAKDLKERRKEGAAGGNQTINEEGSAGSTNPHLSLAPEDLDSELQFASLKSFYQSQITSANPTAGGLSGLGDLGFASPGSISRIMSLYTGSGGLGSHKRGGGTRGSIMREALDVDEGLKVLDLDESVAIEKLRRGGPSGETASNAQNAEQLERVRFVDELRPIPYLLRTKRSKRCPVCRHIISKPEAKVSNTRFRIRLVAGSYIPSISIRPLNATGTPTSASSLMPPPGTPRAPPPTTTAMVPSEQLLIPLKPVQYVLTFKNPLFETVKVTLATPATTPGRFHSKVTVLCPQFDIDANTDMWEDVLKDDPSGGGSTSAERRRRRAEDGGGFYQAEAGKIWERGRNWVSIVVEVVPATLKIDHITGQPAGPLKEDEDLLEIPMFVRIEWEAEQQEVGSAQGKEKDASREKRELAYWCVLGVGRIAQV